MLRSGTVRAEQGFLAGVPPGDTGTVLSCGVESRRLFLWCLSCQSSGGEFLTESPGVESVQVEGCEASAMRDRTEVRLIQCKKSRKRTSNWVGTGECRRE